MKRFYLIALAMMCWSSLSGAFKPFSSSDSGKVKIIENGMEDLRLMSFDWFASKNTHIRRLNNITGYQTDTIAFDAKEQKKYLDCGKGLSQAGSTQCSGSYKLLMEAVDSTHTKVTVIPSFMTIIIHSDHSKPDTVECYSTGALEDEILEYLSNEDH